MTKYNERKGNRNTRKGDFLGKTANGVPVFDRFNSHFEDHAFPKKILKEALSKIKQNTKFEKHVINMGRTVGDCSCVAITEKDEVVMAVRKKRTEAIPMVLNRKPEPCSSVCIILKKAFDKKGKFFYFILITAFVGSESEPGPWDKNLVPGSKEHEHAVLFWQTHALLYDEAVIDHIVA